MNPEPEPSFTASGIAAALGITRSTARSYLEVIPADGEKVSKGNNAKAWHWDSLPANVRSRLNAVATPRGYRDGRHLLSDPPKQWNPIQPLADCSDDSRGTATKLFRAQARALDRRNDMTLSRREWEAMAMADYAREFGKPISSRQCMDLLYRTIERAGSSGDFSRLELYLCKRPVPKKQTTAPPSDADFSSLRDELARCADPAKPSNQEIDLLWMRALQLFLELSANGNKKRIKRRLANFLFRHVAGIAATMEALRRNFNRKLKSCPDGEEVPLLADRRQSAAGVPKVPGISRADLETHIGYAAFKCGGRVAQANRELATLGERSGLSPEYLEILQRPSQSKSYVNERIRKPVVQGVAEIMPFILGKQAIDDATASLRRSYDNLRSMTVLTADDYTWPVYFYVQDKVGRYILTRGQCLLFIDCRSLSILGFSLQAERNYNSLVIRSLDNQVCRKWGIPKYKLIERGIWKNSKVVKNAAPVGWVDAHAPAANDFGWEQLGVRIIHAKRARSKPAELVGGLLQNLMERVIGYCGRDERRDCPEVTRKNKLAVDGGRNHPEGLFLSFEEWKVKLQGLIELYNSTKQDGRILDGRSPDGAFQEFWPHDDPPTEFGGIHAHLYAHWVSRRAVTKNGISFKIGKEHYAYRVPQFALGETVLAWFDPESPELLGVTDLKSRNPAVVERASDVDFLAALSGDSDRETYKREVRGVESQICRARTLYKVLRKRFEPTFRKFVGVAGSPRLTAGIANVGETFNAERTRLTAARAEDNSRASAISRKARKLNIPAAMLSNDENTRKALDMIEAAKREHEASGEEAGI
jgi:hypothetical protein